MRSSLFDRVWASLWMVTLYNYYYQHKHCHLEEDKQLQVSGYSRDQRGCEPT